MKSDFSQHFMSQPSTMRRYSYHTILIVMLTLINGLPADHGIVPDIVDQLPANRLCIKYATDVEADFGNELTPILVKQEPAVSWPALTNALYTLLMIDPDAASVAQVLHWGIVNIPAKNISAGQTIAEYLGAGPGIDTGTHRYAFLIYKQTYSIITELFIPSSLHQPRRNFNARRFASKYNLGAPIAANYYLAAYDDYVPLQNAAITDL